MFGTNLIFIEDCPNRRSQCQTCKAPILPSDPRLRAVTKGYLHLNCYKPSYPVSILPDKDISGRLQIDANRNAVEEWVRKWNEQFKTLRADEMNVGKPPEKVVFSRGWIEAFKYLTYGEICLLAGLTCKSWYSLSWCTELWLTLLSRDFPHSPLSAPSPRLSYLHILTQSCLSCLHPPSQIRVVCPLSQRPICAECYQKPGSSVLLVSQYAALMGVSYEYMREAGIPVYAYNDKNWVFSHQADTKINQFRAKRRSLLIENISKIDTFFSSKDVAKVKSLNLSRAKYIGAILKHRFEGEEDLIDMLKFIYAGCDGRGDSIEAVIRRNKRRRCKATREAIAHHFD